MLPASARDAEAGSVRIDGSHHGTRRRASPTTRFASAGLFTRTRCGSRSQPPKRKDFPDLATVGVYRGEEEVGTFAVEAPGDSPDELAGRIVTVILGLLVERR